MGTPQEQQWNTNPFRFVVKSLENTPEKLKLKVQLDLDTTFKIAGGKRGLAWKNVLIVENNNC